MLKYPSRLLVSDDATCTAWIPCSWETPPSPWREYRFFCARGRACGCVEWGRSGSANPRVWSTALACFYLLLIMWSGNLVEELVNINNYDDFWCNYARNMFCSLAKNLSDLFLIGNQSDRRLKYPLAKLTILMFCNSYNTLSTHNSSSTISRSSCLCERESGFASFHKFFYKRDICIINIYLLHTISSFWWLAPLSTPMRHLWSLTLILKQISSKRPVPGYNPQGWCIQMKGDQNSSPLSAGIL